MHVTRERVAAAIATASGSHALCTELAWEGDVENLMLVLAAIARGAAEWFDDELRVELKPVGKEACTVDVLIDGGGERRERVFRSFVLNVGTDVARERCTELRPKIQPLFATVDLDALVFSTVVEGEPAEERARRDTVLGLAREVITLPFGLPFVGANAAGVPSLRTPDVGVTPESTLPFGWLGKKE